MQRHPAIKQVLHLLVIPYTVLSLPLFSHSIRVQYHDRLDRAVHVPELCDAVSDVL